MASVQEDCCYFSRIECLFFPSFLPLWGQGMTSNPGLCPFKSATYAGTVNSLSHHSTDSGQSMKPLLSDRRGAESCHHPKVFLQGGNGHALTRRVHHLQRKKRSKHFLPLSLRYVDSEFQFLISEVCYQRPECVVVYVCGFRCCKRLCKFCVGGSSKPRASVLEMKIGW